ncbi:MAG: thioesterase family protein [Bacteroidota bacterium]|nr:thioesterase family protein [Bacteroidota bacterium]
MNQIDIKKFRFSSPIHIRWNDLDPIGHVNNVIFFEYFQDNRGGYMLSASNNWDWTKHMFLIAHIEADYYVELKITDKNPQIWIRTTQLGNKSFELEYLITSTSGRDTKIHAKGKSTQVYFDIKAKKSLELPKWLKDDITAYEPNL